MNRMVDPWYNKAETSTKNPRVVILPPTTGIAADSYLNTRRFTFPPNKDLFVFGLGGYYRALACGTRFVDCVGVFPVPPMLRSFTNVAFEINAKWFREGYVTSLATDTAEIHALTSIAIRLSRYVTIYLIDHGLRRPTRLVGTAENANTKVFRATTGRFLEVTANYKWHYEGDRGLGDVTLHAGFRFVKYMRVRISSVMYQEEEWYKNDNHARIALLAWDPN
ncbi:hypothetical protein PWT90_04159 [Aphanocladium album]|nr:hypothetical protein PWT90_04159 [Aphanocladium album]